VVGIAKEGWEGRRSVVGAVEGRGGLAGERMGGQGGGGNFERRRGVGKGGGDKR